MINDAQRIKIEFGSLKRAPASNIKSRGQWLASLTTSGALPGWLSVTQAGLEGDITTFSRYDAPPELAAGLTTSEYELVQIFEQGKPHSFDAPTPLPQNQLEALARGSLKMKLQENVNGLLKGFEPSPSSVRSQLTMSEPIKLPNGASGIKVIIRNKLVNGNVTTQEYVQEPTKVIEEMDKARKYMEYLRLFLFRVALNIPPIQSDNTVEHRLAES